MTTILPKYIFNFVMAATIAMPSYAARISTPSTQEIAPFVYPQNRPEQPAGMTFLNDGKTYVTLSDDATKIVKYDLRTGKEIGVVVDVTTTRDNQLKSIGGFIFSPDESHILIYSETSPIYRRSFTASYYIYEVRHNVLTPLSTNHPTQRAPLWSPDGRMIAFTDNGNIYINKLDYKAEVAVTRDGEPGKILNGVPDWAYEEEFSTACSMAWAPDALTLCYLRYDESQVPTYSFPLYEGGCNPKKEYALYPGEYTYKYPVAGEPVAKVSLMSYDIDNRNTKEITFPDSRIEYIPRIEYTADPSRLVAVTLDRAQTRMEIYSVNPKSTVVRSIYVDEVTDGWIDPIAYEGLTVLPDFFMVMSERSGFNQLYQYSYAGAQMRQITSGDNDVTEYYGYDPRLRTHFYQTTQGPLNRVVASVDIKGKVTMLSPSSGNSSARLSPDYSLMVLTSSNAVTPPVYSMCTTTGKSVRVIEDNAAYASRFATAPKKEFFTFTTPDGVELNGFMVKPSRFDASRRYPVIMSQYSGPGSQEVLDRWTLDWQYFFAEQGYIVVSVDGRGTGGRGKAFKNIVYRNLGHYETADQISAANYVARLPYVDANRIGIYGWSYGGYEALMAASADNNPYAAAVAVAPVTDWRYYDAIYTERYMLTPKENEEGYQQSAPVNHVDGLRCPLLIMHGTADDNVHLLNTIQYVAALEAAERTCDMLLFPNMNHSIYGCDARRLVYIKMLHFFNHNM